MAFGRREFVLCLDLIVLEPSFMSSIRGPDKGTHSMYDMEIDPAEVSRCD